MTTQSRIVLAGLLADKLNIIGDQANLFVLQRRLSWLGVDADIISVASAEQLAASEADFLLLGQGSLAAWKACEREWPTLAEDFIAATANCAGLAVGSGAAKVSQVLGRQLKSLQQPVSEFAVEPFEDIELLGYKYADVEPSDTFVHGSAIVTWLRGPLLAKNPALADRIIASILSAKGIEVDSQENENTRKVDELVAGVWQLEKPEK